MALRRAVVLLACIACTWGSLPASAGIDDAPAALKSHANSLVAARRANALQNLALDGLVCELSEGGGALTEPQVGSGYAEDTAVAALACTTANPTVTFSVGISSYMQIFTGTTWINGGSTGGGMTSVAGAAVAVGTVSQNYGAGHPYSDRFHRGWFVATTSTGRVYSFPSTNIWYVP